MNAVLDFIWIACEREINICRIRLAKKGKTSFSSGHVETRILTEFQFLLGWNCPPNNLVPKALRSKFSRGESEEVWKLSCFFKFVTETISLKVRSTSSPNKKRESGRVLYLHREWTIWKLMRGLKWSLPVLGENGKRRKRVVIWWLAW